MAKRLYISKLVAVPGGTAPSILKLFADLYAANIGDPTRVYAVQAFIADVPQANGVQSYAACIVDCINHTEATADVQSIAFPDLTLDSQLGANWSNQVRNKLTGFGFVINGINSSTTLGDALQILCDQIKPGWNRNSFDVDKPNLT